MERNGSRNSRLRNWCFTLNNPDGLAPYDEWLRQFVSQFKPRFIVFQLEKGENGTPHLQGYVEFPTAVTLATMRRRLPRAHLEGRQGTAQQAADYCRKADSRMDGPWEYGTLSTETQGTRTDLLAVNKTILGGGTLRTVFEEHPAAFFKYPKGIKEALLIVGARRRQVRKDKKVILIYGASHIGKTTFVMDGWPDNIYKKSGSNKWFDGYVDQEIVLIDDFAGGKSGFPCSEVLNLLDKWDCQVEVKGSHVTLVHDTLFVTTNIHPRDWYDYGGRAEHLNALKNRFTQVWTIVNYHPVILKKDEFFNNFYGYEDYPIDDDASFCIPVKLFDVPLSMEEEGTTLEIITISSEEEEEDSSLVEPVSSSGESFDISFEATSASTTEDFDLFDS